MTFAACGAVYCHFEGQCIRRSTVDIQKKSWNIPWADYNPTKFSLDFSGKPWADPDIGDPSFKPKWNEIDGKIDRTSHSGTYTVAKGYPLNPQGRTGLALRGKLGRWGPNHAADPVVTRWMRHPNGNIVKKDGKPVLQFVAIKRSDTGDWAIPGGMVDAGEKVSQTVKREFYEEACNYLQLNESEKGILTKKLDEFFSRGELIYQGIVNDPRNTDNAWIETDVFNFHDEDGDQMNIPLNAGDDATSAKWMEVSKSLNLYANHGDFIGAVAKRRGAYW